MAEVKRTATPAARAEAKVDRDKVRATTEEDIRRHAIEDGEDPEAGSSEREIMAVTGHTTSAMASRYVQKADQKRRARSAITKLGRRLKNEVPGNMLKTGSAGRI